MALPSSGQEGDIAVDNGLWYQYKSDRDIWQPLEPGYQRYFNQSGITRVSGSGVNQVFHYEDDGFTSSMSQGEMFASFPSIEDLQTDLQGQGQGQRIADAYRTWLNQPGAKWPPMKDDITSPILEEIDGKFTVTGYNQIQDTEAIKQFLAYAKMNDLKFTDSPLTGADGTPKAVTIGGQKYFQQPGGDYERIPEAKAAEVRGEGKYEYDRNLGRWVIRQPDGSIQFGPEATQDAKIEVDEAGRRYITQPDGSIQYLGREFEPGVISQGGYNLLQQPSGALSQLAPLPEPAGVETIGGMQFIRTSTGELMPLDNVMNRMMENMVVTGDLEGAAAIHGWITRPSNQEYLDRALAYARSPADQLIISAIARGQGLVAPPPEETIQRIGPPSDYLTEAFNMYRDQMQMGLPEGTQTFADTLAERAAAAEVEAMELANESTRIANNNSAMSGADAHDAAVIANQTAVVAANDNHTSAALNHDAADINNSIAASALTGDMPTVKQPGTTTMVRTNPQGEQEVRNIANEYVQQFLDGPGGWKIVTDDLDPDDTKTGSEITETESDLVEETLDSRGVTFGEEVLGTTGPTGAAATIKAKEESDAAFQAAVDKYGDLFTSGGNVTKLGTADYDPEPTPAPVAAAPSLTTEEALISFGIPASQLDSYASAPDPEPEPETQSISPMLQTSSPTPVVASSPAPVPVAESPAMTTEQALASFGTPASQMGSYATNTPASPDPFARRGRAGGGMVGKREMTMVGESGPELALFPHGTEIIPLDRQMQPSQVQRLRNRGVRGMQEGGIVFDSPLPLGIRQLQAGRSLGAPRGQLLRTAGIALPSAQARRRMLPGEREAFGELGRLAGIPEAEFQQELAITDPSGAPRTTNARMLPLSLRR